MTSETIIPRIVLALVLGAIAVLTYIESVYYHEHSASLGEKAASVIPWVWVFRVASFSAAIGCIILLINLYRR